jgi:ABC-type transport system substrate-binding protein
VRFHDGAPLDGPAVVASFERGRGTAAYKLLFDDPSVIARVDAPDAHTVRFELKAPFGPFLAHLAAPQTSIARRTSGTGPFVAPSGALAPDGTLTLRRNDAYWAKGPGGRQLPYLDGLVLRPVRDPPSRLAELRNGRAEIALDLPLAQATAARGDPNLVLPPPRDTALASLGIDITRPPFERADLRRAIALALDRAALAGLYGPTLRKATQVVPAGMLGYDDSVSEFAALDVAAAKRAVTDARVTTPITVDLAYPALPTVAYPDPQRVAQGISADLAKIGIVARLRAVDRPSVREGAAHLLLETTPIGLDPDDVFWPLFGGTDPLDVSLTVGLLRKARAEADPNKRAELYKQVSKLSRTEVTRIPLLFADRPSAASARVVGSDPNASFATIWLRP